MSIEYIEGDLLDFPNGINTIAHSCNCKNTMGAGIALQIKERYPAVYEADTIAYHKGEATLGNFSFAEVSHFLEDKPRFVYNLYTQIKPDRSHRAVDYEAFYTALVKLHYYLKCSGTIIGFPYLMSCSNAGGSWPIIESMINDVFGNSEYFKTTYIVRNPLYAPKHPATR